MKKQFMTLTLTLLNLFMVTSMTSNTDTSLFSRPLILGASISRGFGTTDGGPGMVISKMINPQAKVTNNSMSGHTSLESTQNLDYFENNPSIVLAFDLFFWDANREQTGKEFEENTRKLFKTYQEKKIPMIVGRVPEGAKFPEEIRKAGEKKSAKKINALLEELCTLDKNCLLYDPMICFNKMKGPLSPEGKPYFGDSMHTTNLGNRFCAEIFVESGIYRKLQVLP
jgi:hypothetical protein